MVRLAASILLAVWVSACGGGATSLGTPPDAPADNDPAFSVSDLRTWYLIGDPVTEGQDELSVTVQPPAKVGSIALWIDEEPGVELEEAAGGFHADVDLTDLAAGKHQLLLAAGGSDTAFARFSFYRSYPLYVLVTNDWDDSDHSDTALRLQEVLHEDHPRLIMTHFVGPYTFTDESLAPQRVEQLTDWVTGMRDTYGDEIGLHIHPYCNFVEAAGVTCRTEPSTVYADGDPSGYTIPCWSYTEEEFTTLLGKAVDLFEEHGLGTPVSFRAGGWTADLSTLHALSASGFVVDGSANNWSRLEEWEGVQNGKLYEWNQSHWETIDDTSQPYYPSEDDILSDAEPTVSVLEVPDNGILVDYVSSEEMIEIFSENWDGGALEQPTAYSIGYHPTDFDNRYYYRMDDIFTHVEKYLAVDDHGPVVYGLMGDMPKVWAAGE